MPNAARGLKEAAPNAAGGLQRKLYPMQLEFLKGMLFVSIYLMRFRIP